MNIKHYSNTGTYISTINPNIVKNKISFSSQINGGLGRLVLMLQLNIDNETYGFGDIIEVERKGNTLYKGIIDEINKSATEYQEVEIVCNGYASLMKRLIYDESSDYTVSKVDTVSNILEDIVDFYNTKYNYLTKDIETTVGNVSYDTNYTDLLKFTNDINGLIDDYYWFIDANGNFIYRPKPTVIKNFLTFQKNIFELQADEDNTNIVNQLILEWKTSTTVYNDADSQALYGIRTKKITNTQIADTASAADFATAYFLENADPINKIRLIITSGYAYTYAYTWNDMEDTFNDYTQTFDELQDNKDIDNIQVGENIKILNLNHNIGLNIWTFNDMYETFDDYTQTFDELQSESNLLIAKKQYTDEQVILDLISYDNFIQLIKE